MKIFKIGREGGLHKGACFFHGKGWGYRKDGTWVDQSLLGVSSTRQEAHDLLAVINSGSCTFESKISEEAPAGGG